MGTLFAYAYPTGMALKQADHTYVTCCEGGHGWGCWGGKAGGSVIGSGTASTVRADKIAEPDERAGVTCYLVNGVCHQAANRILLPAGITVRRARGYGVSVALFGIYGRPRGAAGACRAPFLRHPGVNGDLAECPPGAGEPSLVDQGRSDSRGHQLLSATMFELGFDAASTLDGRASFAVQSLDLLMRDRLEPDFLESAQASELRELRADFEISRESVDLALEEDPSSWSAIADGFDDLVIDFQLQAAKVLAPQAYFRLFELKPGDTVTLTDRRIAEAAYGGPSDVGYT